MKKAIVLCIIGLFIFAGLGAFAQNVGTTRLDKITVEFSQPTLTNNNNYVSVSLGEANAFLMKQGKPLLPIYTQTFTYPFGTKINSVTVTPSDVQQEPCVTNPAPTPLIAGMDQQPLTAASINYGTDPYPSTWFDYNLGCGLYDGALRIIVTVSIYPVQYHPVEQTIVWAHQADIVVSYDVPSSPPQTVGRNTYQLVVIGPSSFSSQIAPLITHKISHGVSAKFVSIEDITGGTYFPATGRDTAEQIKYFIKNAIENWSTGDVLLVGGSSLLPARETHVYIADDPDYGDEIFTSDLYYADIYDHNGQFCSWDSNNNNIFGEYDWNGQTDQVDLHPDVYLARIPATSSSQVTAVVNKIITYEDTPGYQQSWFPTLVLVGGDSFDDNAGINEGEYANQAVANLMTGFSPVKLWVSNNMLTGYTPTGVTNIKNTIASGCGFVDFQGHGNTNIWATHPHQDFGTWVPTPTGGIRSSDVSTLSNGNKLPILTVEACDTARFAVDANCFNWAFLYDASGGAIGTFGATGVGYSYTGTGVIQGLIGAMGLNVYKAYKTDGATSFGELWYRALQRYISSGLTSAEDYKTVEELQPFGDPTLVIGEKSNPPAKPTTPSGPASGKMGTAYTYTSSATDPDGDQVYLMFNWGDNTTSGWVGPYASGATGSATKTWTTQGTYQVKVLAKDTHGKISVWSDPLPVQMPLTNGYLPDQPLLHFLQWLLARFPNAFPLLHDLLG